MSLPSPDDPLLLPPDVLQALRSLRLLGRTNRLPAAQPPSAAGLSGSQLSCLAAVRASPGLRVTQLAQALGIRQATASNLVEALERRGLLERRRDARDQRAVNLYLSAEGLGRTRDLPQPAAGALPDALGRLDPAALGRLNGLLDELIGLMETGPAAEACRHPEVEPLRGKKRPPRAGAMNASGRCAGEPESSLQADPL